MNIFWTGIGLFLVGTVVVILARAKESNAVAGAEEQFFAWFLSVLKKSFTILTETGHSLWERVAAAGTIVASLGILVAIVGLISWGASS